MNIAGVTSRFELVSGLDNSSASKWRTFILDACDYINDRIIKSNLTDADNRKIEMLCALRAYKMYCLCNENNMTSFTAGDVSVTSSAGTAETAEKMWQELAEKSVDLIGSESFIFKAVQS